MSNKKNTLIYRLKKRFNNKETENQEKFKFNLGDLWKYLLGIILIIIYLLPFYVIINVALKPFGDTSSRLEFPNPIFWGNFEKVFASGEMFLAYKNSLIITVFVLLLEVIIGSMAAYGLSRNQSRFNEFVRNIILSFMMISPITILVGVYSLMSSINGISTYWGIILLLVSFGLPVVILLYTNFISSIPISLDEAAAIDGASNIKIFFRIILPQLKPVTISVIILQGVGVWNEYTYSYYLLHKPSMRTVTLIIKTYFSAVSNDYGGAAATAVIGMLPLVILYLFLQKYFIKGTIDSAIKG